MGIDAQHPSYAHRLPDWEQLDDVYEGERAVKQAGTKYLPATSGMVADGMTPGQPGYLQYDAYRKRAAFPTSFRDAVEAMVGVMHLNPPKIELPKALEDMRYNATLSGESLEALLRRMNEQQLQSGRLGLMVDVPSGRGPADTVPYISLYRAKAVINWDRAPAEEGTRGVEMVVLDESRDERGADFTWNRVCKYRLLITSSLTPTPDGEPRGRPLYRQGVFEKDQLPTEEALTSPSVAGRTLERLPFVFLNSADLNPEPDLPPLLGLSNRVLTIYRGEADYRQALFMQGQDTLVVIGDDDDPVASGTPIAAQPTAKTYRIGAGANISLPKGGDAKFIGASADGLGEQRQALENDRKDADAQAMKLSTAGSAGAGMSSNESGEALRVRVAAQTASLAQVAKSGAEALEELLEIAAEWVGADPEEVSVEPNLEFAENPLTPAELEQLVSAKNAGAPISWETIYDIMLARKLAKRTYEEEQEKIEEEEPVGGPGLGVDLPRVPGGPPQQQQQQRPPAPGA